jgi:Ca2+-binding EF-hand superfamily protein
MESREIIETRIRNLVMEAFPHFDTGGTGGLNVQQLGPFLGEVLPKLGDTTLDNQDKVLQVLKQFDLNSDGKLSKIELFVAMDTVFKDKALPVEENVGHLKQVPPPSPPSPTIPQQQ